MPRIFDFISPGVEILEVDESEITRPTTEDGLLLIGQANSGPAMQPIKVRDMNSFISVFGKPQAGVGTSDSDVWRDGNRSVPTYAAYAAQAWLASNSSPVTFVRLLGNDSSDQDSGYVKAGWNLGGGAKSLTAASCKLAYGLFVAPSGAYNSTSLTGTLAAIIYTTGAVAALDGTVLGGGSATAVTTASAGTFIKSISSAPQPATFKLNIYTDTSGNPTPIEELTFHFDPDQADGYIRNVLNTNPQRLNSNNYASTEVKKYFLGESFEESVKRYVTSTQGSAGNQYAFIAPLMSGSTHWIDRQSEAKPSKTGWIISRDPNPRENVSNFTASAQTKLFRLTSLHDGEWFQNNYYASIENLKLGTTKNPNSSFTVVVRNKGGQAVETYSNCNLDIASVNFVGKRIGTQYSSWNSTTEQLDLYGDYENISSYVRIELSNALKSAGGLSDTYALPWGFHGPAKLKGFTWLSVGLDGYIAHSDTEANSGIFPLGTVVSASGHSAYHFIGNCSGSGLGAGFHAAAMVGKGGHLSSSVPQHTASFVFPSLRLTEKNTKASGNWLKNDILGLRHKVASKNTTATYDDKSYIDLLRYMGGGLDIHTPNNTHTEPSFVFTLDEVQKIDGKFFWASGSHGKGCGTETAGLANVAETAASGSQSLLDDKVKQFAVPFFGGFDGLDVEQIDPFSNSNILDSFATTTHYANASIKKAIDLVSDEEVVRYDVISAPGVTNAALTNQLWQMVESRGDALAIIDLNDGYKETYENSGVRDTTGGTVATVLSTALTRDLDTSYAATYFPRIRLKDTLSGNSDVIIAPSSVGALGALAFSDGNSDGPWFAPAGFNRGGLAQLGGKSGPRCVGTWKNLSKGDRDDLYEKNINPIARFPAVGEIVIFGQKTLQATPSALDRVNVRRLMVYLKKKIKDVADTVLFDQNTSTTWNRFNAAADLILRDVQARFGVQEYDIVLDDETTDLAAMDQNIMYAKIFVKPTRSVEFIAIDFIITRSGVEF